MTARHERTTHASLRAESGFKLTAGGENQPVFYLGLETGLGAAGRGRHWPDRTRHAPPRRCNSCRHTQGATAVWLITSCNLTVEPPPSVFCSGLGVAFQLLHDESVGL